MASENNNSSDKPCAKNNDNVVAVDATPNPPQSPTSAASSAPALEQKTPFLSRQLDSWSVDEVCEWTTSLGDEFGKYAAILKKRRINGKKLMKLKS